jgi:hypothetical protein
MTFGDGKVHRRDSRLGCPPDAARWFCLCGTGTLAREMPAADIMQQILNMSRCQGE